MIGPGERASLQELFRVGHVQAEPGPHHPAGDVRRAGGDRVCWGCGGCSDGRSTLAIARATTVLLIYRRCPALLLLAGLVDLLPGGELPGFADFLIAVEAEMNKVSWPSRGELFRASIVVLVMIFVLAVRPVRVRL